MVLDAGVASLAPHLKKKNFHVITLPVGPLDTETKTLFLCHRTLVTRTPQDCEYDVPVLEYSLIDVSGVTPDDATLAGIISRAWTRFGITCNRWIVQSTRVVKKAATIC